MRRKTSKRTSSRTDGGDKSGVENLVLSVKRYNTRNPPNSSLQTFHGGNPQLYHRHINNLYVRGDSVILISLPS